MTSPGQKRIGKKKHKKRRKLPTARELDMERRRERSKSTTEEKATAGLTNRRKMEEPKRKIG